MSSLNEHIVPGMLFIRNVQLKTPVGVDQCHVVWLIISVSESKWVYVEFDHATRELEIATLLTLAAHDRRAIGWLHPSDLFIMADGQTCCSQVIFSTDGYAAATKKISAKALIR